jgi:hypothetical protein
MKTAFRIKNRTYEWRRMPMGFKNFLGVFQRIIDKVLESDMGKGCFAYIDDILIYLETKEEHLKLLKKICMKLNEAGFTANRDEMEIMKEEIQFLGHRLS